MMKHMISAIVFVLSCLFLSSCQKEEQNTKKEMISFNFSTLQTKTQIQSSDGVTYTTSWKRGDKIAALFDGGSKAEFENSMADGPSASFTGRATAPSTGKVRTFYPAAAYSRRLSDTKAEVKLSYIQFPGKSYPDPMSDLLLSHEASYTASDGSANVDLGVFERQLSILKVSLKGEVEGESISSLRIYAEEPLAGTAVLDLSVPGVESWQSDFAFSTAWYSGDLPVAGTDDVYLSVRPCTISAGSTLRVLAHTNNSIIDKSIVLDAPMALSKGSISQLELTVGSHDRKKVSSGVINVELMELSSAKGQKSVLDFQTGTTYTAEAAASLSSDVKQFVDMVMTTSGAGVVLGNVDGKTYKTRYFSLDITGADFAAICNSSDVEEAVSTAVWDNAHAPFQTSEITKFPAYLAVKTHTDTELDNLGVLEIIAKDGNKITLNYKFTGSSGASYSNARTVTIVGSQLYVDGEPFYVKGAAATMRYTQMAEYGANTCRVYTCSSTSTSLLNELHENGLMCYVGLPAKQYQSFAAGEKNYDDADYRASQIATVMTIVNALKDHPAVLCWSLGNELEGGGCENKEGIYKYYGELAAEIRKVDTKHPITAAFTEKPVQTEINLVLRHCPDLDFLSYNSYYNYLYDRRKGGGADYDTWLSGLGWNKPYMITEFGPTGTWSRSADDLRPRVNDWGALIQLSSEEAAQNYIDCYNLIKGYEHCLGSVAFWWGFQTHGQVLGWYPFFTKEFYTLPCVEAMESCWKETTYNPESPLVASWQNSISMNGKTMTEVKNPVVAPGAACTASVTASCRSGNPSGLVYKWFIYKDCDYVQGGSDWLTSVKWTDGEYVYSTYGQHKSMDEDARADLFQDRTLANVSFTAPSEAGIYRLYVIIKDELNKTAGSACLNFKVQ